MPIKFYKCLMFIALLWTSIAGAQTRVTLYNPHPPSHEMVPILLLLVKTANTIQSDIEFTIANRPGGEQLIAFNQFMENTDRSIVLISAAYTSHIWTGKLQPGTVTPVLHLGYACWGLYRTWTEPNQVKDMVIGNVLRGDSTHLTSLQVAEKLGMTSYNVPFRTFPSDAMNVMVGSGDINFSIFPIRHIEWMRERNPRINVFAYNCHTRHSQYSDIPTLSELGIKAPRPFNMLVASRDMRPQLRTQISNILIQAQNEIGRDRIHEMSSYVLPTNTRNLETEFNSIIRDGTYYLDKYKNIIIQ